MEKIDADRLRNQFEIASKKVKQALNSPKGGLAAENEYSAAYQKLVKAGLAQQIRKRYR